jgi:hypothetical protein
MVVCGRRSATVAMLVSGGSREGCGRRSAASASAGSWSRGMEGDEMLDDEFVRYRLMDLWRMRCNGDHDLFRRSFGYFAIHLEMNGVDIPVPIRHLDHHHLHLVRGWIRRSKEKAEREAARKHRFSFVKRLFRREKS